MEHINQTINDTMVSAWTVDMESDEALLHEFLQEHDDDIEIDMASPVVEEMPRDTISLPRLSRVDEKEMVPVNELF